MEVSVGDRSRNFERNHKKVQCTHAYWIPLLGVVHELPMQVLLSRGVSNEMLQDWHPISTYFRNIYMSSFSDPKTLTVPWQSCIKLIRKITCMSVCNFLFCPLTPVLFIEGWMPVVFRLSTCAIYSVPVWLAMPINQSCAFTQGFLYY